MTTELEKAIEDCLKSKIWAERTSALVVLNKAGNMPSFTDDTLKKENELLRKIAEHSRHSTQCAQYLNAMNSCDCGYSKAWNDWIER